MVPDISVVIPAFNEEGSIGRQLAALAQQQFDGEWEVIVADNGSTDGTRAAVDQWVDLVPGLRVIDASRAKGVNVARNEGVRACQASKVAICDADDRVHPGWLASMHAALGEAPAVAGRLAIEETNSLEMLRARRWRFDGLSPSLGFLPYAVGANCAFLREAFEAIGGYDEQFVGGCDDVDFSWRLQLAGFNLVFADDAVVDYRFRETLMDGVKQISRQGSQQPLLFRKHAASGMPRSPVFFAIRKWATFVLVSPSLLVRKRSREKWALAIAYRYGRLTGSLRHRVIFL